MRLNKFYNYFHKNSQIQKKLIKSNNLTYLLCINSLSKYINNENKLKVLDYGCGSGTLTYYLASKGHIITGTDISDKILKINEISAQVIGVKSRCTFINARKLNNKKYLNFFDLVICSEVIEHIKDDNRLIRRLYKLLKKTGILYLSTPSVNAPLYRMGLLSNFDKNVGHLRRYSKMDIEKILLNNKFHIIKIEKAEGILRNILFTSPKFNIFIKFIRGYLSVIFTAIDNIAVNICGESNYIAIAKK